MSEFADGVPDCFSVEARQDEGCEYCCFKRNCFRKTVNEG